MDGQDTIKSPDKSVTKEKKKVTSPDRNTKSSASKPAKLSITKPSGDNRSAKSSADSKIEALGPKWSERFNRIEALLLARTLKEITAGTDFSDC